MNKEYNEQTWELDIWVETNNKVVQLNVENVSKIKIINSIDMWGPECFFIYKDIGYELSNIMSENNMKIYFNFSQPVGHDNNQSGAGNTISLTANFFITSYELIEHNRQNCIWQFEGISIEYLNLLKTISYATNKQTGPLSPYKIINDISLESNLPFDERYIDTERRIDFISSQSMTVRDIITYCLQMRC